MPERPLFSPKQLRILALDPEVDIFDPEVAQRFTPDERDAVMAIRREEGSFGGGIQQTGQEIGQGLSRLREIDPAEALPAAGGTLGAVVGTKFGSPTVGRTIGAGGGAFAADILKQILQREGPVSVPEAATSGVLSAVPTGMIASRGPLLRTGLQVPSAGQRALQESRVVGGGTKLVSAKSEKPITNAMMNFRLRPGTKGALDARELAHDITRGARVRDATGRVLRPGVHQGARTSVASQLRGPIAETLEGMNNPNMGGLSFRDQMRLLLEPITSHGAFALQGAAENNADDILRLLVGTQAAIQPGEDTATPVPRRREIRDRGIR